MTVTDNKPSQTTVKNLRAASYLISASGSASTENHLVMTVAGEGAPGRSFYSKKTWSNWEDMMDVVEAVKSINAETGEVEFSEEAFVKDLEMIETPATVYALGEEYLKKHKTIYYQGPGGRTCVSGYKTARHNQKRQDAHRNALQDFLNTIKESN